MPVSWLGMMCLSFSNQKLETEVRTCPLPGMGVGSTTSKADRRSVVTISKLFTIHFVDVAHLAAIEQFEALDVSLEQRFGHGDSL